MNQPFVELQEVCRFISGGTPSTKIPEYFMGTIPWITGADMNGNVITKARQYITDEAIQNSATNIVPKGNILLVTRTGVGKVAIAGVDICISQDFTGLELDKTKVDEWYLLYYLRSQEEALTSQQRGATIQGITRDVVETLKIPLPPLTEQKRIASLLARADRLRHLRRTAHELGESLLQSVFLQMIYYSETKWEQALVEDLVKKKNNAIRTGPFGSQLLHSEFTESGDVLVLGIDNAVQNDFSWGKPRYITREKYEELKRYTVFPGDLIITIMATNGRVAVVPDNIPLAINTKHLCCITLEQKICLPKFLQACLLYHPAVLKQMGGSERGAVMPGLNMEIIKNLVVPVPPLSLQEEFVSVVARVESLRGKLSEGERQVEGLFESLLAESFS